MRCSYDCFVGTYLSCEHSTDYSISWYRVRVLCIVFSKGYVPAIILRTGGGSPLAPLEKTRAPNRFFGAFFFLHKIVRISVVAERDCIFIQLQCSASLEDAFKLLCDIIVRYSLINDSLKKILHYLYRNYLCFCV